jgi:excisionase family DNA binding protein
MTKTPLPPPPRRYATIRQASEYLGVNPATVRRYVAAGRVPAYRVGAKILRVDLNEVDALLVRTLPTASSYRQ